MRYLLGFILILVNFSVSAQNRFPSVDSAKNYVLRYVKNSAVETFTNWRAQNVAYGTLELLDSLAGAGAIDSIWKTGDTLKYSKSGVNYTIGTVGGSIPTLQQVTTAGNSTTDSIISPKFYVNGAGSDFTISEDGAGRLGLKYSDGSYSVVGLGSVQLNNGTGFTTTLQKSATARTYGITMPDSSGTLTQRVAINGTTYNTVANGVVNLGNTDTATVVKAYVTNAEAVTITRGQVVYIFGAQGDRASVKLAKNTSDTFSSKTLGIVRADIAAGQAGWVTTQGQVSGINLGAYTAGDILWLDSVAGGFTKTKPEAPYHSVFVGVVERANAGNGLIYVKPQNGQELGELHDVKITSPTNNQVLSYTASTGIWENKTVSVDTTSLSNRINQKLNISDTASMLNPYLRKADTLNITSLFNRASNKLEFLNEFYHLDNFITGGTAPGTHVFAQSTANKFSQGIINAQISSVGSRAFLYQNGFSGSAGPIHPDQMTGNPYIFETRVKVDTCTATDTLFFYSGLLLPNNVSANSYGTNYALFVYDPRNTLGQGASRFIQCVTSSSGARTTNISTVLFSPTTFRKLRMEIKSTEVKFFIDGNLVATHTNNLPGGASIGMNYSYNFGKTVGSTTMNAIYDYWGVEHYFDTKR